MTRAIKLASARRGDKDYVNNPQLYAELVAWYESGKEAIPDKIVIAVMQICERLGRKSNFVGYSWREEMISSAQAVCIVALQKKKFNPELGQKNPFAYFSQIAYNEMVQVIKREKVHSYIKHKALDHHITDSMLAGEPVDIPMFDHGDRNYDLINYFEKEKVVVESEPEHQMPFETEPDEVEKDA